ncbi:leucyl aminopeptidase [Mycoplasmopsis californica HAZ160_1]|uniref:Probable cytosol aminopeptidase n=1 Tax=Mycoplasmopsis californica HAZ160_1 TaxID=1397850 RepID=A0AAT9F8P9_9BACT|nr:M17 family metallopeptidase [Mycoplasmopsis californica]BAP01298.1 leucyl aminopeptidase [Mycoplasmopsis californica HAZ160_1]BBG41172.1 leucyl aminopeptidase [Mycoplasmopsis californica]BBG41765.1 leucyl aminopeptidase [Mycoplasmopsis californica]BBG42359.1 leucyl aminopeptidase [Mycoplasmopsis californica]BBG42934.1 leucyl aminopeptidase [Mycoplasmopsis californica]
MLFEKISQSRNNDVLLKAHFKEDQKIEHLIEKNQVITEYLTKNEAFVYFGEKSKLTFKSLVDFFGNLATSLPRNYQFDVDSFTTENLDATKVMEAFIRGLYFQKAELYNLKSDKKITEFTLTPYKTNVNSSLEATIQKAIIIAEATNYARNLQVTPPNVLNSEKLAQTIVDDFKVYDNLKVSVLDKKQIEELKMGLLLSVNRGSMYEARVVVVEYNGDPESTEKTVLVGKGITFDSGGYSLKPSRSMLGMKFDMSGSVIVASTLKAIAQLKPKKNFTAVMCITDNRVNGDASLPDSVWTSMNGKSVEINNTDAEGRLVLADGITYAVRNLKATRIIDVATLTGAIVVALGHTYSGVWATSEKAWEDISKAAKNAHELIWRMPFDEAFGQNIKKSQVADLKNTDLSGNAGSCSAAMFLKEFTEDVEYIHIDIAGTADISEIPQGVMVKTLTELALI